MKTLLELDGAAPRVASARFRFQAVPADIEALNQRAETILKVAIEIVKQQDGFFRHGIGHLRPLVLRDVADAIEDHRITADETQELREKWDRIRKRTEAFVRRCEKGDFSPKG